MIKRVNETKSPMKKGVFKRVCLALVVLLLASVLMVGAGSADDLKTITVTYPETIVQSLTGVTEQTIILELSAGTFSFPDGKSKDHYTIMKGKNITFKGTEGTVIDATGVETNYMQILTGTTLTFDNVAVMFPSTDWPHSGLANTVKVVYKDCTLSGVQNLYAPDVEFINCTFEGNGNNDIYYINTYAAQDVIFDNCTFNTGGKAILVYNEWDADNVYEINVTLNYCIFNSDSQVATDKAAVETGSVDSIDQTYNIEFNGCTVSGFTTHNSNSPLWGNYYMPTEEWTHNPVMDNEHLKVTINHKVTWQNHDNSILYSELVLHETTPAYSGGDPTKPADDTYEYEFIGWNPDPQPVTNSITYTAQFKAIEFPPSNDDDSSSQGSSVWLTGPAYSIYTAHVENGGSAYFSADFPIFKVTMPDAYSGDVTITTYSEAESPADKNVYIKADIKVEPAMSFGETATIHFKLPLFLIQQNGLEAADVCLYHRNGGWTKLPTQYSVVDDIVYYEAQTDSFSPFAIVFEENAATPKDATTVPTETETQSSGFGVLAVLAGLGCVLVLRRK